MNERLGLMDDLRQRRESLVDHLSPGARHQAFPTIYAKPVPLTDPAAEARAEAARLSKENEELRSTVRWLKEDRRALAERLQAALANSGPRVVRRVSIAEVQVAFCEVFNELGGSIDRRPYTLVDLASARRSKRASRPRMACMDLVRTLCPASFPSIGEAFGGRDHTTVMHAIKRAPIVLADSPLLGEVHAKVLALFEMKQ